jgi:hypothetical protein
MKCAVAIEVLKELLAGQVLALAHDACHSEIMKIDFARFAAFGFELQMNLLAANLGMMISESRKAVRAVGTGVFFIANADQGAIEERDDGGNHFFAWQARLAQMPRNLSAKAGKRLAEGAELFELSAASVNVPLSVIEVLLAAAGIATSGLQVTASTGTNPDIGPSGRNAERLNAVELAAIANRMA